MNSHSITVKNQEVTISINDNLKLENPVVFLGGKSSSETEENFTSEVLTVEGFVEEDSVVGFELSGESLENAKVLSEHSIQTLFEAGDLSKDS